MAWSKFAPTRIALLKSTPLMVVVLPLKSTPYRKAFEKSVRVMLAPTAVAQLQVNPVFVEGQSTVVFVSQGNAGGPLATLNDP